MNQALPESAITHDSDFIIFGGSGDLSIRKIFPALFWRFLNGQITNNFRLISCMRNVLTKKEFADKLRPFCEEALKSQFANAASWESFLELIQILELDIINEIGADNLYNTLRPKLSKERPCVFYLAVAPKLFGTSCLLLKKNKLVLPQSRVVVEKPFGHDKKSALALNQEILNVFDEGQIYRIDHYLGKETVQNLMALRFANVIFESQWNNRYIDHVQITTAETVGVEQRASYYDSYGALRDMVQNHMLQLLCLVAMEPPSRFNADQVRNEKLRVLQALRKIEDDEIQIGQYENYTQELNSQSNTETYVAMRVNIDNWRWAGVPFYIRTGKKLGLRASEIVITFKNRPHDIFSEQGENANDEFPNRLVIRVQPQEGLRLHLTSKKPGPGGMRLFPSELNLSFDETFAERLPDAYERLLMDIARGNQTLFMRSDEVLAAWDYIDPVIEKVRKKSPEIYSADSMGPEDKILIKEGRYWFDPILEQKE